MARIAGASSTSAPRRSGQRDSVSNSGGVAVRPVTATRIAMNRSPAFQPRSSARARSGGSSSSASKRHRADVGDRLARGRAGPRRGRGVPALRHERAPGRARRRRPTGSPTRSPIAPSVGSRSWTTGSSARSSSSDGIRSIRPASQRRPRGTAAAGRSGRPASSRRIHWPFSHSSRSRSNTAPPLWTCSRSNRATSSSSDRISSSVPGRPAEQREVVDQRLADEALGAVVVDRGLALALAHLRAVGVEDQRQVGERRRRRGRAPGTAGCAWACSTGGPRRG